MICSERKNINKHRNCLTENFQLIKISIGTVARGDPAGTPLIF